MPTRYLFLFFDSSNYPFSSNELSLIKSRFCDTVSKYMTDIERKTIRNKYIADGCCSFQQQSPANLRVQEDNGRAQMADDM